MYTGINGRTSGSRRQLQVHRTSWTHSDVDQQPAGSCRTGSGCPGSPSRRPHPHPSDSMQPGLWTWLVDGVGPCDVSTTLHSSKSSSTGSRSLFWSVAGSTLSWGLPFTLIRTFLLLHWESAVVGFYLQTPGWTPEDRQLACFWNTQRHHLVSEYAYTDEQQITQSYRREWKRGNRCIVESARPASPLLRDDSVPSRPYWCLDVSATSQVITRLPVESLLSKTFFGKWKWRMHFMSLWKDESHVCLPHCVSYTKCNPWIPKTKQIPELWFRVKTIVTS